MRAKCDSARYTRCLNDVDADMFRIHEMMSMFEGCLPNKNTRRVGMNGTPHSTHAIYGVWLAAARACKLVYP